MSKAKLPLDLAHSIAQTIVIDLSPAAERIEIAGSIRREKPEIGDIEIVCIPTTEPVRDMFGEVVGWTNCLLDLLPGLAERRSWKLIRGGEFYRQYNIGPCCLDLFLTTPEKWGVIYTIRTGSADFSHRLVTPMRYGGFCPSNLRVQDGRVWQVDPQSGNLLLEPLETPEEMDVFETLGLPWIEPSERT